MRLGTCIAVEIVVGATTLTALGAGTAWGLAELREYLDDSERAAARAPAEPRAAAAVGIPAPAPPELPPPPVDDLDDLDGDAETDEAPPPVAPTSAGDEDRPAWRHAGLDDGAALAPLRVGRPVKVKFNRGGTSLSLRIDFDNGARAAFKPEQIHPQSNPRREIAAYRLDRLLGLDRVPPAIGRTFRVDELIAAIPPELRGRGAARLREEALPDGEILRGEVSWWIPVIKDGTVSGFQIDDTDGIVTWRRMLKPGAAIPEDDVALVRQISDMTVFDYVIDNIDRWSGNNAKVSPDNRVLYFMDNTMGFTPNRRGHRKSRIYLDRVQTFSRRLIERLRGLTEGEIRAVLALDTAPFEPLLTDDEIAALLTRRDRLMEYVDALVAEHGEDKVLVFP